MSESSTLTQLIAQSETLSKRDRHELLLHLVAMQEAEANGLTPRQRAFIAEFAVDLDRHRAALAAGYTSKVRSSWQLVNTPIVSETVRTAIAEVEARCDLNAEYVRSYIHDVLEVCPTDYFTVDPETEEWVCDLAVFNALPKNIKRLIEGADLKREAKTGRTIVTVKFVSKAAAMSLAARYTLVQKHDVRASLVPWDSIVGEQPQEDPLELRIANVGALPQQPAGFDSLAVAEREALQGTTRDCTVVRLQ